MSGRPCGELAARAGLVKPLPTYSLRELCLDGLIRCQKSALVSNETIGDRAKSYDPEVKQVESRSVSAEKLVEMYTTMLRIRKFEETIVDLVVAKGVRLGLAHLYIGEEAVATGVCANLRKDDYIISTHRGHGHCIAKGTQPKYMMAELFGKKTGTNKGKGGSMHIAQVALGNLGANGIVAAGIPHAVGAGLSIKIRGTDQVSVSFFGDGATNQGVFHEALNIAAILSLPVIFVCENNMYAIGTAIAYAARVQNLAERAAAYGIPGVTLNGMDVVAVYEAARDAVARARQGRGPTLLECKTYRYKGHSGPYDREAYGTPYRTEDEVATWKRQDPIPSFLRRLLGGGVLTPDQVGRIEAAVVAEIEDAVTFAIESPDPAPEDALEDLFAE